MALVLKTRTVMGYRICPVPAMFVGAVLATQRTTAHVNEVSLYCQSCTRKESNWISIFIHIYAKTED